MGRVEQLNQDKTSLEHKTDGLQSELSKYKELLDSSQLRVSDISQEREKAVQQVQESAKKDIDQLKHIHQLEIEKASTEADRRVLEAVNKTKEEYTAKLDSLAQKSDRNQEKNEAIVAKNQELTERIHALEMKQTTQEKK